MKIFSNLALVTLCILVGLAAGTTSAETVPLYDVYPEDAYDMVTTMDDTYILDVRTADEYYWVGHPGANACDAGDGLSDRVRHIPYKIWRFDPRVRDYVQVVNPVFNRAVAKMFDEGDTVILMSRDGSRSHDAAVQLAESENSEPGVWYEIQSYSLYNMLEGFEGGEDECGYRTLYEGWKNKGFPYNNSAEGVWMPPRRMGVQILSEKPTDPVINPGRP
jgi:rhodanese-related sulfurtransferase